MKCLECGSENSYADSQTGEVYCRDCGLLLDDAVFENHKHVPEGNVASLPQLSRAGCKSVKGRIVQTAWLYNSQEKRNYAIERDVELISSQMEVPKRIVKEAKFLLRQAVAKQLNCRVSNLNLSYAAIYAACSLHGIPKTPLEITDNRPLLIPKMMKAYRILCRELQLHAPPCSPADLIPRFGSKVGLSNRVVSRALDIVMKLQKATWISGKSPRTIAGSALYVATKECGERVTQREIANTVGIWEFTLRNRSREITKKLGLD